MMVSITILQLSLGDYVQVESPVCSVIIFIKFSLFSSVVDIYSLFSFLLTLIYLIFYFNSIQCLSFGSNFSINLGLYYVILRAVFFRLSKLTFRITLMIAAIFEAKSVKWPIYL
jgi:hypothetical protein